MAWRDTWHARYYVWALQPEIVLAGQVDTVTSSSGEIRNVTVKNITSGAVANVKRGMTIVIGTVAQRDRRGRARVRKDGSGSTIYVQASTNLNDGELDPSADDYIEVWNDYRVWLKPPYSTGGGYYYDGGYGPSLEYGSSGTTTDQWPIANGGPAYAQFVDPATGLITVDFDASGSFAVADDAVLGGYTADLFGGAEVVTSSSGTASNAVDGNTATACQFSTTGASEYIQVDWGLGNDQHIRKFDLTCHASNNPAERVALAWSDDGTYFVWAFVEEGLSGWGIPDTQTFYNHDVGAHRYWRIYPHNASGGCYTYEWAMYAEDRVTSSPYSWDVNDGTITVGSATTESITATFPAGFRYVHLTVTDTNAQTHIAHVPVLGVDPYDAVSTAGASYDSGYTGATGVAGVPASAHDGSTGTYHRLQFIVGETGYNEITLSGAATVYGYDIWASDQSPGGADLSAPKTWEFLADGAIVDSVTDEAKYTGQYTRYLLDVPVTATTFRLKVYTTHITDLWLGETMYGLALNELRLLTDPEALLDCEIRSHVMEASGQTLEIDLHQVLPESSYPDGTLVLAWQDEYYNLTAGSLATAGPSDREHMLFMGWIDTEPTDISAEEDGLNRRTSLRCIDTGGRLKQLADFSLMAERDAVPGAALGYQMKHANADTFAYLMVEWLSTAASVSDFFWSQTADHYNIGVMVSQGANLFEMINQHATAFTHRAVCNKHNQIKLIHDPLASDINIINEFAGDDWDTLTSADYQSIPFTRQRTSRYHWIQGTDTAFNSYDADSGSFSASPWVAMAPGNIPGQGANSTNLPGNIHTSRERILTPTSGGYFAQRVGVAYARLQAPNSLFEIVLAHNGDNGIDPAEMNRRLLLTIDSDTAAQRGQTMTSQTGYVMQKRIDYDHEAMTRTVTLLWEKLVVYVSARLVIEPG